jgi:ParB family chromosome partitioning protein
MSSKNNQPFRTIKKGSGLDVLFGDGDTNNSPEIDISLIKLPPQQPRRYFDGEKMEQLTQSVKNHGIIEPLLVRPLHGMYELVAGERRYRAAQKLKLTKVPVIIRELTDQEALELTLVENLHREDLNPVEETEGILQLIALRIGKSSDQVIQLLRRMKNELEGRVRHNVMPNNENQVVEEIFQGLNIMRWESFVKNRLPLLNLPDMIRTALQEGKIAYTKARAISSVKDKTRQQELLEEAINSKLSLREIKERIKQLTTQEKTDYPDIEMEQLIKNIKRGKLWETEPKKWQKVEKLLEKIKLLLDD